MPHLKRLLWLLAWGVWLWLGVGLYRELPRDLGPVVCSFHLRPNEWPVGFLKDGRSFVTGQHDGAGVTTAVLRRSAETGEIEATMTYDGLGVPDGSTFSFLLPSGLHLRCPGYKNTDPDWKVFVLDMATGRWRTFTDLGDEPQVHRNGKWVLFRRSTSVSMDDAIFLLDLETGQRLFDSRTQAALRDEAPMWPVFFVGADRFAFPVGPRRQPTPPIERVPHALEIWSVSGKRVRRLDGPKVGDHVTVSDNGTAAWYASPHCDTEAHDLETGACLQSIPRSEAHIPAPGEVIAAPAFSADARRLLSPPAGGLFDVATGARVWAAARHEKILSTDARGRFEVEEQWSFNAWGWGPKQTTYTVRSITDGSLVYRTWQSTLDSFALSPDGTLLLTDDAIHETPPRVNWPFVAFCQAVLALPLVLLWRVLRWRRRRQASGGRQPPAVAALESEAAP